MNEVISFIFQTCLFSSLLVSFQNQQRDCERLKAGHIIYKTNINIRTFQNCEEKKRFIHYIFLFGKVQMDIHKVIAYACKWDSTFHSNVDRSG